jgi:phosphotransferase system HPr (HPr) family protein
VARATLTVTNEHGLHARPAAEFVQTANRFHSAITLRNLSRGGRAVNAKSITQLLIAGVDRNCQVELLAEGDDADQALEVLTELLNTHNSS